MSTDVIVVELPTPPSANDYWRSVAMPGAGKKSPRNPAGWGVRVLLSSEAREYKKTVYACFRRQHGLRPMLNGPIELSIVWRRARRAGDVTNRIKVVEDCLQNLAYKNDSQVVRVIAERFDNGDPQWVTGPGVTVTVCRAGAISRQEALSL